MRLGSDEVLLGVVDTEESWELAAEPEALDTVKYKITRVCYMYL